MLRCGGPVVRVVSREAYMLWRYESVKKFILVSMVMWLCVERRGGEGLRREGRGEEERGLI